MSKITALIFIILFSNVLIAKQIPSSTPLDKNGDVRIPLTQYNQLVESGKNLNNPAPAEYAIGQSEMTVSLLEHNGKTTAHVNYSSVIKTFENKWALIPLLPYGTTIDKITINDMPVQLVQSADSLSWSTNKASSYSLNITYTVDIKKSSSGYVVPIPIPRSASTTMTVNFADADIDLAIVPSSNLRFNKVDLPQENKTIATANIPTTSSVLLSWRVATEQPYVISRADYKGSLTAELASFEAHYDIELFTNEVTKIKLLPNDVTLSNITINDQTATIIEDQGHFYVIVNGKGKHIITVFFQTQVLQQQGPPTISFPVLRVPISQIQLQMKGRKNISAMSIHDNKKIAHHVINRIKDNLTTAQLHIPMAESVSMTWNEAIPKDMNSKLRANANIYHSISAEEGVLYGHALLDYEITHGQTNNLTFIVPARSQINQVKSSKGGISDWNVKQTGDQKVVTVFLNRFIKDNYQLNVFYEQLLDKNDKSNKKKAIDVPLITAKDMHRQRGIVALLAGLELTLKPIKEVNITRVGENQLPAFFRNQITLTIAHTFKYTSNTPQLTVNTIKPEKQKGKYDAQIDTLISLGEVTMRGNSSIQVAVKSGGISDLQLHIPKAINVLNITGPSIRNHKLVNDMTHQVINIEFTQEMTGQFRIEFTYEKILGENKSELNVPSIQVKGTQVQHGRIAVEALTAVEVQTKQATQLSSLAINELPQQLILKTTNPILLAFKYVNTKSPHSLKLSMTRHQEIDVQVAAIESAHYQTLMTNDGLSVTTAQFFVRNSRQQFLRLKLPENSEIWSVFVDGKPEKPAMANDTNAHDVLIKMLNSVAGFPVEVIYATPIAQMGLFGTLSSQLPLPDMVVTHTLWDVYLPVGPNYQAVTSNMQAIVTGQLVNTQQQALKNNSDQLNQSTGQPLHMKVPHQGIKYSFEKLYANQSETLAGLKIRYASELGNKTSLIFSIISVLFIWLAIFFMTKKQPLKLIGTLLILGIAGLLILNVYYHMDTSIAFILALTGGALFIIVQLYVKLSKWFWNKE